MAKKSKTRKGRKSKYDTNILPFFDRIIAWRKQGQTEKQIAKKLDVGVSTWEKYKKDYPEFKEILTFSKELLVEQIEESLFTRAMGKHYKETEIKKEEVAGMEERVTTKETIKYLPPDTTAIIFSLKNLDPTRWSDRKNNENININTDVKPSELDILLSDILEVEVEEAEQDGKDVNNE